MLYHHGSGGLALSPKSGVAAALIELVIDDDSIEPDEEFFVVEDGSKIKKATFSDLNEVCLPALLLGVWHYAVTKRKDNKVGKQTYDNWCPPAGGGPRVYHGDIGERVRSNISRVFVPARNLHAGHASKNSEKPIQNTLDESKKTFTAYIEKATERYNVMRLIGGKEVSLKDFFVCNTIGEKERVFADKKKIKCLYLDNPRMNTIRNMYLKQRGYDNKDSSAMKHCIYRLKVMKVFLSFRILIKKNLERILY